MSSSTAESRITSLVRENERLRRRLEGTSGEAEGTRGFAAFPELAACVLRASNTPAAVAGYVAGNPSAQALRQKDIRVKIAGIIVEGYRRMDLMELVVAKVDAIPHAVLNHVVSGEHAIEILVELGKYPQSINYAINSIVKCLRHAIVVDRQAGAAAESGSGMSLRVTLDRRKRDAIFHLLRGLEQLFRRSKSDRDVKKLGPRVNQSCKLWTANWEALRNELSNLAVASDLRLISLYVAKLDAINLLT
ncbi:hypothetical protein AAMO2058_000517400 [Amorphochlora amoebiformis]